MRRVSVAWLVAAALAGVGIGVWSLRAASGPDGGAITGFSAKSTSGESCDVQVPGAAFEPVKVDARYPFGATLKTGRNSSAVLEFSAGNRFRVLARTTVVVTEDVSNPNVKRIKLNEGGVALELDNLPKGVQMNVETPTAVCGAVGTHFEVSYVETETSKRGLGGLFGGKETNEENRFVCSKGEVFAESSTFEVKSLREGTGLNAVVLAGRENSATRMSVSGGAVEVAMGGGNRMTAEAGTALRAAQEKGDQAAFVAVVVDKGSAKVGETTVDAGLGSMVLEGSSAYDASGTGKYVDAAETEGRLQAQLDQEKQKPQPDAARVAALDKQVADAAAKATELRQRLTSRNVRRLIQEIRRIRRPPTR